MNLVGLRAWASPKAYQERFVFSAHSIIPGDADGRKDDLAWLQKYGFRKVR